MSVAEGFRGLDAAKIAFDNVGPEGQYVPSTSVAFGHPSINYTVTVSPHPRNFAPRYPVTILCFVATISLLVSFSVLC